MLKTESTNLNTINLDQLSTAELVATINKEDQQVIDAIAEANSQITECVDEIYKKFEEKIDLVLAGTKPYKGPRLFYVGAGTSGRLGILDAAECPPTFSVPGEMVQGIIAGGDKAIQNAVEGAEDNEQAGYDFVWDNVNPEDCLVAISASGGAPYVIGALRACAEKNILSIAIANNSDAQIFKVAQKNILLDTGPEVLAGSTRLKAGSAQKMVLNIISTSLMVKLGKVYQNLMVDVNASNTKLINRAKNLVMKIAQCNEKQAIDILSLANMQVKTAIVMINLGCDFDEAEEILAKNHGRLRACLR